jgi:hypothetical protein
MHVFFSLAFVFTRIIATMASSNCTDETYYSVSTLNVLPQNVAKVSKIGHEVALQWPVPVFHWSSILSADLSVFFLCQVAEFFTRVSEETLKNEPAAQIYKWYKVAGKDQFVYIEQWVQSHVSFPLKTIIVCRRGNDWADDMWCAGLRMVMVCFQC